ncbi:MAG: GTPase [Bacteriovoracaceae bacterium]
MVSAKEGLQPFDEAIYRMLKKSKKPFWLVVNKSDGPKDEIIANEFLRLRMPEDSFYCVSGAHGVGVIDLKEKMQKFLNEKSEFLNKLSVKSIMPKTDVLANVAIIGLPNAGKSSLLNRLLKENRAVVSNIPGTTVDPIEGYMDLYFGEDQEKTETSHWKTVKIVDTAGIRKRANIKHELESQSVFHALKSITSSDVVLYCIDANKGVSHQDLRLCEIVLDKGKSLMVILNKIDLRPKELQEMGKFKEWLETVKERSVWLNYCEFLPISVKTGEGLGKLKAKLVDTINIRINKIPTNRLNNCLERLTSENPLILEKSGGKRLKVKYASVVSMTPPTVLMFCNGSLGIPIAYRKYLIKGIREEFEMKNTPIHLIFRNKISRNQEVTATSEDGQESESLSF